MSVKSLGDLFHEFLKDVYYAEKKLLAALPQMARKSASKELQAAIQNHRDETETHVTRLEQVFALIDQPAKGKKCPAIEGLIEEAKEHMSEIEDEMVRDAAIVGAAQSVEHYEIARYGTLVAWADHLGNSKALTLLEKTLDEEKAADELLTEIAEGVVNPQASQEEAA